MAVETERLSAQLPDYAEALFRPIRYKIAYGGRGASRSWTFARALLMRAANKKLRILCTREIQSSIKDSVHQLLRDQITLLGINGYTVTEHEIRHACGSQFLFEGLRYNVQKIKSLEGIDICWVEEAERITKESWDVLIPTIRKEDSEIWVTFNPDQEDDATYVKMVLHPPDGAWVKKITWRDNPWFSEVLRKEKDHAYKTDPNAADHVWEGNCRKETAAQILHGKWCIEEFQPFLGHVSAAECPDIEAGKECSHARGGPYQGIDFGFADDPFAATRSWIGAHKEHGPNCLYHEYEVHRQHLENDHIVAALAHPTLGIPGFARYLTRADSARPDTISYLKRHGLPRIIGAKKGPGSVEDGITHLRSYDRIIIHPRCVHTIEEHKHYSYKVDERSGDILPDIIDKHNHAIDAERYALEPMIKPRRRVGVLFPGAKQSTPTMSGAPS